MLIYPKPNNGNQNPLNDRPNALASQKKLRFCATCPDESTWFATEEEAYTKAQEYISSYKYEDGKWNPAVEAVLVISPKGVILAQALPTLITPKLNYSLCLR